MRRVHERVPRARIPYVLLLVRVSRDTARRFSHTVRQPPNWVEYSDAEREEAAFREWLARFDGQNFSLTDAVSFVVMTELGIREALTLDRHLSTVGFEVLAHPS